MTKHTIDIPDWLIAKLNTIATIEGESLETYMDKMAVTLFDSLLSPDEVVELFKKEVAGTGFQRHNETFTAGKLRSRKPVFKQASDTVISAAMKTLEAENIISVSTGHRQSDERYTFV